MELSVLAAGAPTGGKGTVKATLGSIRGDVSIRHPGGSFVDATGGEVLEAGDDFATGPDGQGTLLFSNGDSITLEPNSQANLGSLFNQKDNPRIRVSIRIGKVAAKIAKSETATPAFTVRPPNATVSSRGTAFSVFYDPGSRATIVRVTLDSVSVQPVFGGKPVIVNAGQEVEVTAHTITRPTRIGQADANGGIDRQTAWDRVLALLGRDARACGLRSTNTSAGSSVKPVPGGWQVTIAVAGGVTGASTWRVAGNKAIPTNALAKTIAAGCPGGSSTTSWTGTWKRTVGVPGNLILQQTASSVSGTYTWSTGGTIQGTISGKTLTASFNETNYRGTLTLTLSGTQFTGTYTGTDKLNNGPISGPLNGTCTKGPCLKNK